MNYEYQPKMANTTPYAIPNTMQVKEENMYPDVYKMMYPHVVNIMQEMETKYGNINITQDFLDNMCDELVRRSGLDDNDPMMDSVPTIAHFHRSHHRGGGLLSDLARILFLREIFGRRRFGWR